MYIEVLHDVNGDIFGCWCADTLPQNDGDALVKYDQVPAGFEQARVNIDTLLSMEIEAASGQKAVIDDATGLPKIINTDRAEYIMGTFRADLSHEIAPPAGITVPAGMKIRALARKA